MVNNIIHLKKKTYYLYESCPSYEYALTLAKKLKKEDKRNKYWIMETETGFLFPEKRWILYCTKFMRIQWW